MLLRGVATRLVVVVMMARCCVGGVTGRCVCVGVLFVGSVGLHARWLGGDMVCVSVRTYLPATGGRCDVRHMAWCYGPGWMRGWMDAWRD